MANVYNPNAIDVNSLIPWLNQVFAAVSQNKEQIANALQNHTAYQLIHGLFGADASGLGLTMPGTEADSRTLYDPFGTGEDSPFYAFRHLSLSPEQRQALYSAVSSPYVNDPFMMNVMPEFFALNPDDLGYYWNASTGAASGFDPSKGRWDYNLGGFVGPGAPAGSTIPGAPTGTNAALAEPPPLLETQAGTAPKKKKKPWGVV